MEIITLGDETLTKPATLVADIDKGIADFTAAMLETMMKGNGIGLAASQVGYLKRIFVCHFQGDIPRVFINPEILRTSNDQETFEEGCLSIPGIYADVVRPEEITVQAWDEKGKPFTIDADGLLARVIQHEMDHLRGVLFIDHLNPKKRERVVKQYYRKVRV